MALHAAKIMSLLGRELLTNTEESAQKVRVLLAGRFSLSRRALRLLLERENIFDIVDEAETPQDVVRKATAASPDVILVETLEREDDGLDVIMTVRGVLPQTHVFIVTTDYNEEACLRALRLGVSGYLLASAEPSYLCLAIRAVNAGQTIVHSTLAQALMTRLAATQNADRPSAVLTLREIEVIRELTRGLSDKQIAMKLSIAESTVKIHLRSVYQKLGLRNRTQATVYAVETGLV